MNIDSDTMQASLRQFPEYEISVWLRMIAVSKNKKHTDKIEGDNNHR